MIRNKDEVRVREVANAQGGRESVFFHDFLLPEEAEGHGRVFSELVLPPGASIGYHEHKGEFECLYVISGEASFTDGDREFKVYPGGCNICPDGHGHGVENRGEEELHMIALIMKSL